MRSIAGGDSLVESLLEEHGRLREAAARLEHNFDLSKTLFDAGDLLERHIRCEERELFPLFEKHVSESQAERIKREIAAILERPSPSR
jgi:hemerythrin-like domain-containing protein